MISDKITYEQSKDTIQQIYGNASNHYMALVEMFSEVDTAFATLCLEVSALEANRELSFSASILKDAHDLVLDIVCTYAQEVAKVGLNQIQKPDVYVNDSDTVHELMEKSREVTNVIDDLSFQITDFSSLFSQYQYSGIDNLSYENIQQQKQVHKKISRISDIVYRQIKKQHEELTTNMLSSANEYDTMNFMYESIEGVESDAFVSLIEGITLIEVGETYEEALEKTKEYFEMDKDDVENKVEIKPCSKGVYHEVAVKGVVPEDWTEVNGVIVLPEEEAMYQDFKESIQLAESSGSQAKAIISTVENDIVAYAKRELETKAYDVRVQKASNMLNISFKLDSVAGTTEKFKAKDYRVMNIMANVLSDIDWVDEAGVDRPSNKKVTLSVHFGDLSDVKLKTKMLKFPKNEVKESILKESTEKLDENKDVKYKAAAMKVLHEIQEVLSKHMEERGYRTGIIRKFNRVNIDVQPDRIFGNGQLSDSDIALVGKIGKNLIKHNWIEKADPIQLNDGSMILDIMFKRFEDIDLTIEDKFELTEELLMAD